MKTSTQPKKEKAELVFDIARDLCIEGTERMAFVIGTKARKEDGNAQMIMLVSTMTTLMISAVLKDTNKDLEQARQLLDAMKSYALDMLSIEGFN